MPNWLYIHTVSDLKEGMVKMSQKFWLYIAFTPNFYIFPTLKSCIEVQHSSKQKIDKG